MKKLVLVFIALIAALSLSLQNTISAQAAPVKEAADSSLSQALESGRIPDSDPADVANLKRAVSTIKQGETRKVNVRGGYSVDITRNSSGVGAVIIAPALKKGSVTVQASPCAWAVASAIVGIGAAAIALLAVATAGAGGVAIAGAFVSTNVLNGVAAGGFGFGSILALVSLYVC